MPEDSASPGSALESQADLQSVLPDETEPEAQGQEATIQKSSGRALCTYAPRHRLISRLHVRSTVDRQAISNLQCGR